MRRLYIHKYGKVL